MRKIEVIRVRQSELISSSEVSVEIPKNSFPVGAAISKDSAGKEIVNIMLESEDNSPFKGGNKNLILREVSTHQSFENRYMFLSAFSTEHDGLRILLFAYNTH